MKRSWRLTLAEGRRILGLDPGSRFTGYGVVERRGSACVHLAHGRLAPPAGKPLSERLVFLVEGLEAILVQHQPAVAALETLFFGINPRSLIVLAQARGALMATVARAGIEICEYSPSQIKTALTGSGRADKEQVTQMVRMVLGLGRQKVSADAGDALAAAICAAERRRFELLMAT